MRLAVLLFLLAIIGAMPQIAIAQTADEIEAALADARSDAVQLNLPQDEEPERSEEVDTSLSPRKPIVIPPVQPPDNPYWEWIELTKLLAWMAAIFACAILAFRFGNSIPFPWSRSDAHTAAGRSNPTTQPGLPSLLAQSDELAQDGLYAQAMHELLLGCIQALRRRLDATISASLTSREIIRLLKLPSEEVNLFAEFVGMVEHTWFGNTRADGETYRHCRACFLKLTPAMVVSEAA